MTPQIIAAKTFHCLEFVSPWKGSYSVIRWLCNITSHNNFSSKAFKTEAVAGAQLQFHHASHVLDYFTPRPSGLCEDVHRNTEGSLLLVGTSLSDAHSARTCCNFWELKLRTKSIALLIENLIEMETRCAFPLTWSLLHFPLLFPLC